MLSSPPCCQAGITSAKTVAAGSLLTIQFDGADTFDTDGMHNPSVNNTRVTINTDGVYLVAGHVEWQSVGTAASSERITQIRLSGSSTIAGQAHKAASTDSNPVISSVTAVTYLTAGSYLELRVANGDSASKDVAAATLTVAWLGVGS